MCTTQYTVCIRNVSAEQAGEQVLWQCIQPLTQLQIIEYSFFMVCSAPWYADRFFDFLLMLCPVDIDAAYMIPFYVSNFYFCIVSHPTFSEVAF